MLTVTPRMADEWMHDFPLPRVELPRIILADTENQRSVRFDSFMSLVDVEGVDDITKLIPLCERLAESVRDHVKPPRIERLGLRQFLLYPGVPFDLAKERFVQRFWCNNSPWSEGHAPGEPTDVGIVAEYLSGKEPSRMQFGPYVPNTNLIMFQFKDDQTLIKIEDGFVFDLDRGEAEVSKTILNRPNLGNWIMQADALNRARARDLLRFMEVE